MDNLKFELSNIKWWEDKNEGKDRNIEYDLDFEHEVVEHIAQGDVLHTMEVISYDS